MPSAVSLSEVLLRVELDPDQLSFVHAVRVIKRRILTAGSLPPSGESLPS
jgi:hypothetical protein